MSRKRKNRNAKRKNQLVASSGFQPQLKAQTLSAPDGHSNRGWMTIFDWQPGAYQADATPINPDKVLANWAVYACLSLISSDCGKLRIKLMETDDDFITTETRSAAFSPVLKKPNHYQTRQKFVEQWIISKLGPCGNVYVLKERDNRGVVVEMHVLDPYRVTPLIAPDGSVFYRLGEDWLCEVTEEMEAVPASEIIHDRAACLFHPLVGISPIFAVGLAAQQGLSIQNNSEQFFRNKSMPGGIITAPTEISEATAERLKREWNKRYSGENAGATAVLGDGMKYDALNVNARDSQLTEQLKLTATMICSAYHVPPFKIGFDTLPAGQKVEDMNRIYYSDCLQALLESIEALLDEGLGLDLSGRHYGTEFDIDNLLRMDTTTLVAALKEAVAGTIMSPNEARFRMNLRAVKGGEKPMSQQQNWSLEQLANRKGPEDRADVSAPPAGSPSNDDDDDADDDPTMLSDLEFLFKTAPLSIRGIDAPV